MNKIKSFVDRLANVGTENVTSDIKSFIILTNLNGISYFALDLTLAVIFYGIIGDFYISVAHVCAAFAFLICSIGFNFLGWTNASRLSTVLIGTLLVLCCAFYLGPQSFAAGTLLLGAIFPFVYFSLKERKLVILSASFPVIGYILLITTNYNLGPQVGQLSDTAILLLSCIFFLFPLAGIIGNCHTAVSESNKKTEILAESKKVIETIFYALTHDLASPMQTIAYLSHTGSQSGSLSPDRLNRMNQSTEHMIRIFKNLQTVAQTSSEGKISFQLEKCSLATLIKEALNFSSVMAQNKNIYFEFDQFDTEKEINVYVDRDVFIFQIFTNFITNSLKYSESGQKIRISLNLLDMKYAQISIRDWGQGIPPEKINDLFSWSTRTTTRGTAGEKGSGLGLPLANKFLKSMNGNLEIRSSLAAGAQRGTEIIITLPILEEMQKNSAA